MPYYQGWGEAEVSSGLIEVVPAKRQLNIADSSTPSNTLTSFTPVSRGSVLSTAVQRPLRSLSHGVNNDNIFGLPPDDRADLEPPKKKKQKLPKIPPQAVQPTGLQFQPGTSHNAVPQLVTPPDSSFRTADYSSNKKWTTTEAALRAGNSACAQTTLDKLAAFRYQALQPFSPSLPSVKESRSKIQSPPLAVDERTECSTHAVSNNDAVKDPSPWHEALEDTPEYYDQAFEHICDMDEMLTYDDDIAMEAVANLDDMRWQDISPIPKNSYDEFPVDEEELGEMDHLQMMVAAPKATQPQSTAHSPIDNRLQICKFDGGQSLPSGRISLTPAEEPTFSHYQQWFSRLGDAGHDLSRSSYPFSPVEGRERIFISDDVESDREFCKEVMPEVQKEHPSFDDSVYYLPLERFARPAFPSKVSDRSPITGISANMALRTCFRIGEARCKGALSDGPGKEVIIELFARVKSSSKASNTCYHFQVLDLFHEGPPFLDGQLNKIRKYSLQETEIKRLLGLKGLGQMVRCLGRLKKTERDPAWMMHIINIRATDWEEIRWTKSIVGAQVAVHGDPA